MELRALSMSENQSPEVPEACPWETIEEDGSNLRVEDFLTVPIVRLSSFMRRFPSAYTKDFDLTLPQWRLLSTVAYHSSIPLGMLVEISAVDKALVSRTVRQLQEQELVDMVADPGGNKKKLNCVITRKGKALTKKIMPMAQRSQAKLLLSLSKVERVRLYAILKKLEAVCDANDPASFT
ncbi:MarR family winged helix-turn-helix transcriptional regulator [soil metagenome]